MGKRIACICGKPGRVQHTRMKFLRDNYLPYLDVYADDVPDLKKYDVVYFSHYSLAKKVKFDGKRKMLASVTSHKYDKKELGKFDRISVNNRILLKELAEFNPVLTENGVDTKFWTPPKGSHSRGGYGWVGNGNRRAKRIGWIRRVESALSGGPASGICGLKPNVKCRIISTSKSSKSLPYTPEEMRDFYRGIVGLVVTSESEGTPNPALEAMACGAYVISTPVGNMVNIDKVLLYRNVEQLCYWLGRIPRHDSDVMRNEMVDNWDWSIKYMAWDNFFKEWL